MNSEKYAIFLHSSSYDRLYQAVSICSTASSFGKEVYLFLFFSALKRYIEGRFDELHVEWSDSDRDEFLRSLETANIPSLHEMIESSRKRGNLKVIACSASVRLMGLPLKIVREKVDGILGLPSILKISADAEMKLYI